MKMANPHLELGCDDEEFNSHTNLKGEVIDSDCSLERAVAILKDQVAFLAKRVLVLHFAQSNIRSQSNANLLTPSDQIHPVSPNIHDRVDNDSQHLPRNDRTHGVSVETQTDASISEDSPDSGCLSSSNGSPASTSPTYESQHELALEDGLAISLMGDGEMTLSDTPGNLTTRTLANRSPLHWTRLLLKSLLSEELSYTNKLRIISLHSESGTRSEEKPLWRTDVESLFCRHSLFLKLLTCLKHHCRNGLHVIRVADVMVHLLRFWSDQETIEKYLSIIGASGSSPGNDYRPTTATRTFVMAHRHVWNHLFFLSSYLKGIRDSSADDIHLEHVLQILFHILDRANFYGPDNQCPKTTTENTMEHPENASNFTQVINNSALTAFHVEFMEGSCTDITVGYVILSTEPSTATEESQHPKKVVFQNSRPDKAQRQYNRTAGQASNKPVAWKKLLKILKQSYQSPNDVKPFSGH